jgi:hypothetical protein
MNVSAGMLGPVWYFRRRYFRKGMLLSLAILLTTTVPVSTFILSVISTAMLPIAIITGTKMGPNGAAVSTTATEQARMIEVLVVAAVIWFVVLKAFWRLWRRALVLLAVGFALAFIHPLVASVVLWAGAAVVANFDDFTAARPTIPRSIPISEPSPEA